MSFVLVGCHYFKPSEPELAIVHDPPAGSSEPESVVVDGLPIGNHSQLPDYPAGCEIVSLMNALEHFDIHKTFDETFYYFNKSNVDFVNAWWGDPHIEGAAYPPAMTTAATRAVEGTGIQVQDITGETIDDIRDIISREGVVLIWYTTDYGPPRWTNWEVDGYHMYDNEHCAVVYFMTDDDVCISDPLNGSISMNISDFDTLWKSCGSMAVAMYKE